jgi:uncharacterized oxidoreductase
MATTYHAIKAEKLHDATSALLRVAGSEDREAKLVADHLIEANLKGHDSHGVGMMPSYLESLRTGRHRVNRHAQIVMDAGAMLTIDGDMGFGPVIAYEAMELGIARTKQHGVAVISLRRSHHTGRIGHWAEQCAEAGIVSTHYVAGFAGRGLVAPFGGTDARFSTNPFCAGFPVPGEPPIILDFATSRLAAGKVRVALNKGEQVMPGVLLNHNGSPTTDPSVIFQEPYGALLSFGEHKGYGLALMCELMSGALSGGGTTDAETVKIPRIMNNMLSIMIDPSKLGGRGTLERDAKAFLAWVRASPPAPGVERVLVPGEPERMRKAERTANGIPVDATTWNLIAAAGESIGLSRAELHRIAGVANQP